MSIAKSNSTVKRPIAFCDFSAIAGASADLTIRNTMKAANPADREIAKRLALARETAGYVTAKEFADKNGIPQSTYANHEMNCDLQFSPCKLNCVMQ